MLGKNLALYTLNGVAGAEKKIADQCLSTCSVGPAFLEVRFCDKQASKML
jgi:hypothetical protein